MDKQLQKQQIRLEKQQAKFVNVKSKKKNKVDDFVDTMEQKIPKQLKSALELAFYKGFQAVFEKGSAIIEKTYSKEKMTLEHEINNFTVNKRLVKKGLGKMNVQNIKSNTLNSCTAFVEGAGLGILGIGLPDIPIFIGVLLKGIYETAISYGFDYKEDIEKVWILRIIRAALAEDSKRSVFHNDVEDIKKLLTSNTSFNFDLDEEIKKTSDMLCEAMLFMKFVQGLPVVGIIGSVGNFSIYQKVAKYSALQYKLRYINRLSN